MNMHRRVGRLEASTLDLAPAVRVLLKKAGEPDPIVEPPLKLNEQLLVVTFVPGVAPS